MKRLSVSSLVFFTAILSFAVTPTLGLKPAGTAAALQSDPAQPSAPTKVGAESAGSFADATGHSAQSHLVYAANAGVWWLFTLTSDADSAGGASHIVQAYRSSGADSGDRGVDRRQRQPRGVRVCRLRAERRHGQRPRARNRLREQRAG